MLRSFRFANHKSFRDEAELLLLPAYDKSRPAVPVAAVFGANASGKSNLLDALRWLQSAVRESYAHWEPGSGVPRVPFRLDPEAGARPSFFCVEIVVGGARYTYGLEVNDERVVSEWLYAYPHNRRRIIFEREVDAVRLGSTIPDHRTRADQLARVTRDNTLFLSAAVLNDFDAARPVYDWFRTGLRLVNGGHVAGKELLRRLSDKRLRQPVVELISAADLGITDITAQDEEQQVAAFWATLNELLSNRQSWPADVSDNALRRLVWKQLIEKSGESDLLGLSDEEVERRTAPRPARLLFHHGRGRVPLGLEDQSAGTKSWIGLISAALDAIETGSLMVIDEVDASLHPHLTARLINLFRDTETNSSGAQLLFTTHDPTLLDEETLARDEIWFVEKDPDCGATRLYPLTDFRPRKREDREGRYLAGSYGAIPLVSDRQFRDAIQAARSHDAAA